MARRYFGWLVKQRGSDWERQRLAGRRREAPPKPAGKMPALRGTGCQPVGLRSMGFQPMGLK